jgi:hypothetical protein
MATAMTYAQVDRVATLTHGGTTTAYYGVNALQQAHEAAVDGDYITLSMGTFNITAITKNVTIIGSGMKDVPEQNVYKTNLYSGSNSRISIGINESTSNVLRIENVEFSSGMILESDLNNANFVKCSFPASDRGISENKGQCKNVTFMQCTFENCLSYKEGSIASFINCYVWTTYECSIATGASISFNNCTIGSSRFSNLHSSSFLNCVLYMDSSNPALDISNTIVNCLGVNRTWSDRVWNYASSSFFKGDFKPFKADTYYELTDDAKALITSTDGTEIGMYGGAFPYNPVPDGVRITKFTVAPQSSADNKLNVEVEVTNGN